MIKKITDLFISARDRICSDEPVNNVSTQGDHIPAILFFLTILFYIAYLLAMQPSWVLGGEMWAEMATNYFPNANSPFYAQKLFATDAGYIPAPQRLIALVGNAFNLPASSIPYFYTWSAIFLTGMMIGVFCLKQFRVLVKSDGLRFVTAIAILIVADFETRTFINFTYFAAFFIAIITALALVDNLKNVPWWAWFMPVLVISKPAVLATLPAMMVVAVISKSRFRRITIVAIVLCIGQIAQMVVSQNSGVFVPAHEFSYLSKTITSFKYFFGLLGGYISGPNFHPNKYFSILVGFFILLISGRILFKKRSNANALVFVGFSLLYFNILLNSFVLSDSWNGDMAQLGAIPLYRHIIVGFFGSILMVTGLIATLSEKNSKLPVYFGLFVFLIWFIGTGWLSFGGRISREPESPLINNSQWQNLSSAIDSGLSPICVPIDPSNWFYARNCGFLDAAPNWGYGAKVISNPLYFNVNPPVSLSEKTLVSLALLVKPYTTQKAFISSHALIELKDGSVKYYSGERDMAVSGGLILLTGKENIQIKNISAVRFMFNAPVEVSLSANDPNAPNVLWMGN